MNNRRFKKAISSVNRNNRICDIYPVVWVRVTSLPNWQIGPWLKPRLQHEIFSSRELLSGMCGLRFSVVCHAVLSFCVRWKPFHSADPRSEVARQEYL